MGAFAIDKPFTWLVLIVLVVVPLIVILVIIWLVSRLKAPSKQYPSNIPSNWSTSNNPGSFATATPFTPSPNDYTEALNKAIQMAQAGQKAEAYQRLKALETSPFQDINLLLWLAFTSPYPNESEQAISKALRLEPGNPTVLQAQEWLKGISTH